MTINQSGWRPEMGAGESAAASTFTGNRALMLEEALIFEIGDTHTTGVDIAEAPAVASRLGGLERRFGFGLPGLSEPVCRKDQDRVYYDHNILLLDEKKAVTDLGLI